MLTSLLIFNTIKRGSTKTKLHCSLTYTLHCYSVAYYLFFSFYNVGYTNYNNKFLFESNKMGNKLIIK